MERICSAAAISFLCTPIYYSGAGARKSISPQQKPEVIAKIVFYSTRATIGTSFFANLVHMCMYNLYRGWGQGTGKGQRAGQGNNFFTSLFREIYMVCVK
jgi:hypothetical protein